MKKSLYIFSGLGADERVFRNLDFSDYEPHFIKWVPIIKDETIQNYATRISIQIEHSNPVLVGLSFGGIIGVEVAKQIQYEKLIIIASAKNKNEIPFYYRLAGKLNLHKLMPERILKVSNIITNYLFGAHTDSERLLLKQILSDTDSIFLKWAINSIVKWDNVESVPHLQHIHGTKDRILPFCFVNPSYKIVGGGHFMTLSHSKEIMAILRQEFR